MIRPAILVRLSREDLKSPGAPEEKVARHLAIARELAERYHLPPVPDADIYIESGVSGRRLSKRPDTIRLLDRCRTGYYSHVVTAYQSRVLRGDKRDEADIEDAFLDGEITLITTEGEIRFDESYDSSNALVFEIRAAADRNYVRDIIKKLRESNRQRTMLGQRSAGMAPYGYFWQVARYDQRRIVEPAHYVLVGDFVLIDSAAAEVYARQHLPDCLIDGRLDGNAYVAAARRTGQPGGALLPGVECTGGEYRILCEIFRRIRSEGYTSIVRSLNERHIPTSGSNRFNADFAASIWHDSSLRNLVRNLHYSGFPAHTVTTDRKGRKISLPADRHVLPNDEQPYPHPMRLPEHRELLERITSRAAPGSARLRSATLLTGLLRCAKGQPCRANSTSYECRCGVRDDPHLGEGLSKEIANRAAVHLLDLAIKTLPARGAPVAGSTVGDRPGQLIALDRETSRKRRDLDDLRRHAATFARAGGSEAFAAAIEALEQEIAEAERNYRVVQHETHAAEARSALTVLEQVQCVDFAEFWAAAETQQQRAILRLVFERFTIVPQSARGRHVTYIDVTPQPWIKPHFNPGRFRLRNLPDNRPNLKSI